MADLEFNSREYGTKFRLEISPKGFHFLREQWGDITFKETAEMPLELVEQIALHAGKNRLTVTFDGITRRSK